MSRREHPVRTVTCRQSAGLSLLTVPALSGLLLVLGLRLGAEPALGPAELSHLSPHLEALPPRGLLRPQGDGRLTTILRGYDRGAERRLAEALLAARLHSRLLRVGVASNGRLTAALVKLQAGDRQSGLLALADMEQDAARALRTAFRTLPRLGHVDLWAILPWEREFRPVHRPVFSVSVPRAKVADLLASEGDPGTLLARCGGVRVEAALLEYALEGPEALETDPISEEAVVGPALDSDWLTFSGQARSAPELGALPREGAVRTVLYGPKTSRKACLTIDDGPHPLITPLILDTLRRERVKATFFVVGELVEQYPELARMILRDGHELGNHTYSHIPLSRLNPRGVWAQLRGWEVAIERACGVKPRWFRPPGGDCTEETLYTAGAMGYTLVMWTGNTGDWRGIKAPVITANALRALRPGGIILIHQDELESLRALPMIVAGARAAGLTLGSVGEVAGETSVVGVPARDLLPLMRRAHTDW